MFKAKENKGYGDCIIERQGPICEDSLPEVRAVICEAGYDSIIILNFILL